MPLLNAFGKCPCCNNPWNRSDEAEGGNEGGNDEFDFLCQPCTGRKTDLKLLTVGNGTSGHKSQKELHGINPQDFDRSVDPGRDFYSFAVGSWRKNNPIPDEYPSWDIFTSLHDLNQKRLKEIVDELEAKDEKKLSGAEKKIADFFVAAMDVDVIEKKGWKPYLQPIFDLCGLIMIHCRES